MNNITKEQLLDYMAPCSLLCYTCPGFVRGAICKYAEKLHNHFQGYYDFQAENLPDEYKSYAEDFKRFDEKLEKYTKPKCNGCRNNPTPGCSIRGCFILECTKEHGVDFCGECNEFPCNKVNTDIYNPTVIKRWLRGNNRIKEIGAKQFFEEEKTVSHYIDFKKEGNK